MCRGGGRGGGVGGGGGGIGGRVGSSSHSPSHGALSGSTVVRDAAAITGGYLGYSLIGSVSNNFAGELWYKRAKVSEFKPSWNDWWTRDLKRNFCRFKSDCLKRVYFSSAGM
ncbi:hypothetical protein CCACVL1_25534 [Corchorus capsularis]|uniref:Uncharacterized protein n=1 Tax=Corchorus capsularis TaxID=210143 RepID=A0A1R3GJJ0_COCAP|nr:hypothetical protein CCACVL1_25534 [Corchorus capsularis]